MGVSKRIGFRVVDIEESTSDVKEISASFKSHGIRSMKGNPFGIHVPGGIGVEPILYLFGKSAKKLAELGIDISAHLVQS